MSIGRNKGPDRRLKSVLSKQVREMLLGQNNEERETASMEGTRPRMYPETFVADAFSSAETSGTSYTSTPAAIVQGSYVNFVCAESDTSPPLGASSQE
jgi:hypothetical protein